MNPKIREISFGDFGYIKNGEVHVLGRFLSIITESPIQRISLIKGSYLWKVVQEVQNQKEYKEVVA